MERIKIQVLEAIIKYKPLKQSTKGRHKSFWGFFALDSSFKSECLTPTLRFSDLLLLSQSSLFYVGLCFFVVFFTLSGGKQKSKDGKGEGEGRANEGRGGKET